MENIKKKATLRQRRHVVYFSYRQIFNLVPDERIGDDRIIEKSKAYSSKISNTLLTSFQQEVCKYLKECNVKQCAISAAIYVAVGNAVLKFGGTSSRDHFTKYGCKLIIFC